jgi:uncharacterized protein involved in response to NO
MGHSVEIRPFPQQRRHAVGAPPRFALWNLGFRPLYLLASVYAALAVALWVAQYAGVLPFTYVRDWASHGAEMLFGYATAVIVGFLFTAVRNWTGRPTPNGAALAGIALLWVAGRLLAATPHGWSAAIASAAFPAVAAVGIAVPLARARNRRNYFFVALLVALAVATLALHLSRLGVLRVSAHAVLQLGLDAVLVIMAVVGGRVIPMFTNNGVPGTSARRLPWLERLALGGLLLLAVADLAPVPESVVAALCAALALLHASRLALWQPWRTLRTPIVWVLHAAYAWIVVYLALRAMAALGLVATSFAVHALTIGAIGGLTLGMMTRTARGHTGAPLAADRRDVAIYVLVMLAALVRVGGGLALPRYYLPTVIGAAACWTAAFTLYALAYAPRLVRPRADGKPG